MCTVLFSGSTVQNDEILVSLQYCTVGMLKILTQYGALRSPLKINKNRFFFDISNESADS